MKITEEYLLTNGYEKFDITDPGITNPYGFRKVITVRDIKFTVTVYTVRPLITISQNESQNFIVLNETTEDYILKNGIELMILTIESTS